MLNLGVKSEVIKRSKTCACCKEIIEAQSEMFYGHSGLKNPNGDCSVYVCEKCMEDRNGYVIPCTCGEMI